jgi:hypothetical protein
LAADRCFENATSATRADVPVLWLGTAERISAVVEMKHPGVWVMGDLSDDDRGHGMGIVVEYAGQKGEPQWVKPEPYSWDYTMFGKPGAVAAEPDESIEMTIVKHNAALNGFNKWTLNGEAFSMETRGRFSETDGEGGATKLRRFLGFRNNP